MAVELPDGTVTNVSADQVVVTGRLENVTLEDVIIKDPNIADVLDLLSGQEEYSVETFRLEGTRIDGLVLGNATVDESSVDTVSTASEPNGPAIEPVDEDVDTSPGIEADNATIANASVENVTFVNLTSEDGAVETTIVEDGETTEEAETGTDGTTEMDATTEAEAAETELTTTAETTTEA
jgi:hypothetical protein